MSAEPRLVVKGIKVRFGATEALRCVDFELAAGEIHALLGENGAGKSTLMKILAGATRPDSGEMLLDGKRFSPHDPGEARAAGVAMIYQELVVAPHLTVSESINLGAEPMNGLLLDRKLMHKKAQEALAKLGHDNIPLDAVTGSLSVSQMQLVEIARAIASDCRVLILDEPTSSLTRADVDALFKLLGNLRQQGYAIIYISHFLEEVREIADRFTILRDGAVVTTGDVKGTELSEMITMMIGSKLEDLYLRSPRTAGEPVLELDGVVSDTRLRHATIKLYRGEVLGIAGLVGSGRTELMRAIFGLDKVTAGEVRVAAVTGWAPPAVRWRQAVGLVSEDRKDECLAQNMSIADNIVMARGRNSAGSTILLPAGKEAAAQRWIDKLAIKCSGPWANVQSLSGGNQQKISFARLLNTDVDVLLLDEPTKGIDVGTKHQIYSLIDELACAGKSVLMISSYLPELLGVCDRIAVMHRGKLSAPQPVEKLTEDSLMLAIVGGGNE